MQARGEEIGFCLGQGEATGDSGGELGFALASPELCGLQAETEIEAAEAAVQTLPSRGPFAEMDANGVTKFLRGVVESLAGAEETSFNGHLRALGAEFAKAAGGSGEPKMDGLGDAGLGGEDLVVNGFAGFSDDLGGGGRGGGAAVGDEVSDGEVSFVADGGDDGRRATGYGASDVFFVERPEIFERSAAAGEDDDVGPGILAEVIEAGDDLRGCLLPLNKGGEEANV